MNRRIIPCQVRDEYVVGSGVVAGAAGSGGDTVLQLEFGPMWEGLVKYVTFRDALKENPVTVILTTDMMERIAVPEQGQRGRFFCPEAAGQEEPSPCPHTLLVYNVPIPTKAKAIAGQMGVVVQGYAVTEDGSRVEAATMTANAYYKILPADHAPVEDGSVTPTLSQQLQGQIEAIRKDIVGAAGASDAKEAAEKAAQAAEQAKAEAEQNAQKAEESAGEAKQSEDEAKRWAKEAQTARDEAKGAQQEATDSKQEAVEAKETAVDAREKAEEARDRAQTHQLGAEEAEKRGKGYRDEALSARDAARDAQKSAERARDTAVGAKETAEECRTQAWIERLLAEDARDRAEEASDRSETAKTGSETAQKESQKARDEAVLALQWIRMKQNDIRVEQAGIKELGSEVRKARDETVAARNETLTARDEAKTSEEKAVTAAEEAARSAAVAKAIAGGDVVTVPELEEALKELSGDVVTVPELEEALKEFGKDVPTRQEAKGYVQAHNTDPLAHEGLFPRIGAVAGIRIRDSWRPDYGLGGGGAEAGINSVVLELEPYTGTAEITAVVSGIEYDPKNLGTDGAESPNGTIIIQKMEE